MPCDSTLDPKIAKDVLHHTLERKYCHFFLLFCFYINTNTLFWFFLPDEKEKFEPTVFRDTIVQGLNESWRGPGSSRQVPGCVRVAAGLPALYRHSV